MATVERVPASRYRPGTNKRKAKGKQDQASQGLVLSVRLVGATAFLVVALQSIHVYGQNFQASWRQEPTAAQTTPVLADQQKQPATLPENQSAGTQQPTAPEGVEAVEGSGSAADAADDEKADTQSADDKSGNVGTSQPNPDALQLSDVIASVYSSYPSIEKARLEGPLAQGMVLEAMGAYDTKLQGYSLNEPTGFYRNYRQGIGVARQTWWGGYLSAGYRIGRGSFQPWYKERETNEGGEFKLGLGLPLLQGRAIDADRVAVFQAQLAGRAAGPAVQYAILRNSRDATVVYWEWIAAGSVVRAQQDLLELSIRRGEIFKKAFDADRVAEIDLLLNDQLIAERQGKLYETQQKFRATAFKLSLYLRDEAGQPIMPADNWLPQEFPPIEGMEGRDFNQDLADALTRRPELSLIQIQQRQVQLDQQLARNNLLPALDLLAEASQDSGVPASSSNDKGQFELLVGVQGEVPLQRRKARGKIQSTSAKIGQLDQELRLQRDKIGVELQTAYNALIQSRDVVAQGEIALQTSRETLRRFLIGFQEGKYDLIYINLLESKVNETEIKLLEARRNWFTALVDMQTALGLDPLDQSMMLMR